MSYINLLLIILFILGIFFYNNIESFVNCNKKIILGNKNIYVNNKQNLDIENLNCNKLCIKEPDGNIECITKHEMFNALNLPAVRRHGVCIDDTCLSKNDIQKLNGDTDVQFKSLDNKSCMGYGLLPNTYTSVRKKYLWESGGGKKTRWDMTSGKKKGCVKGRSKNCRRRRKLKRRWIKTMRRPSRRFKRSNESSIAVHSLMPRDCNNKRDKSTNFELVPGKPIKDVNVLNYTPTGIYSSNYQTSLHQFHEKIQN